MSMEQVALRPYVENYSQKLSAATLTRKRIMDRNVPFGIRAMTWYKVGPLGDTGLGIDGGSAGFVIVPMAGGTMKCGGLVSRGNAGITELQVNPEFFINGGIVWIPFPASVYVDWPDKTVLNNGDVYVFAEQWDGEYNLQGNGGLSFTRLLRDGQTILVPEMARKAECSSPNTGLQLDGGQVLQTGPRPQWLAGSLHVTMRFFAGIPAGQTHAPVTFHYDVGGG